MYDLSITARPPPDKSIRGTILYSLDYHEDKVIVVLESGGGGGLYVGDISGDALRKLHVFIKGEVSLESREAERKAVVNASALIGFEEYNETTSVEGFVK